VACSVTLKRNVSLDLYNPTLVVSCRARERCDISYLYIKPSRSFREKRWKVCAPRSLPFLIRFSVSRSSSCRRNFSCAKIARSFIQLMVTYKYIYTYIYIYIFINMCLCMRCTSRSRSSDSLFICLKLRIASHCDEASGKQTHKKETDTVINNLNNPELAEKRDDWYS